MKHLFRWIWMPLIACMASFIVYGAKPTQSLYANPLYDLREARSLKPTAYTVDALYPLHLFPVPHSNAVGTNDLKNAITVISFNKDRLVTDHYFRNALGRLSGGGQYLPTPISGQAIAFAQTRRFLIFDFKTKAFENHRICTSMDDSILKVGISDANAKHYFFEVEEQNPKSEDWHDFTRSIWLMDLSGDQPRLITRFVKPKGHVWSIFQNKLFLADFTNNTLKAFNNNLTSSHHPLVDCIRNNKGKVDFVSVIPHPTLSFALLTGGEKGTQYVCWNQTFRDEKPRSVFGLGTTVPCIFSPDGRWVAFLKDEPEPKRSYIMPISEKYPNYLGSPILLEEATFDRDHFAWTNFPVALVGAAGNKIYRYDLSKEGHPEAANYPSYWDYVVEKDLEKLRKAGKQGLGQKPPAGP